MKLSSHKSCCLSKRTFGGKFENRFPCRETVRAISLEWRHNGRNGVSNHQPHDCLLNRLFRRIPKRTSKPCITGLCAGNSPVTGEFPAQRASDAENVSIWLRHHVHGRASVVSYGATKSDWRHLRQATTTFHQGWIIYYTPSLQTKMSSP